MKVAQSPAGCVAAGRGQQARGEERQIVRAVIGCFLVSGAVGLIYEVLWIRMLGLVFGHTVFAVTTVLASFMGGLGLGSAVFGRVADGTRSPLRLYGLLEIGIGLYCFFLPALLDGAATIYLWVSRSLTLPYVAFNLVQFALIALLLVPPTFLMGATLPVLTRFFVREEQTLGRQVGLLYSANTWGAVAGTLLAGYFLVPSLGIQTTLRMAVVANVGLGALVLAFDRHLRRLAGGSAATEPAAIPAAPGAPGERPESVSDLARLLVAAGFAASGAASMVYEITWTRALTLSIGSSTYAFTAMLAAFLCGIAGGSWAFALVAGRRQLRPEAFAALQVAIGLSCLALVPAFERMPLWFLTAFQFSQAPGYIQGVQFLLSFAAMLAPTLLIGATFPCAVRILTQGVGRVGYDTGWIYAVNTVGAILGSGAAGFLGVPALGIQWTMRVGIGINLAVGIAILVAGGQGRARLLRTAGVAVAAGAAAVAAVLPPWNPTLVSSGVAIYGRQYLPLLRAGEFASPEWQPRLLSYRDGISGTVTVHQDGPRLFLRVNGKTDAGTSDMHTQLLLGHLPMLLHPAPRRVLVIGLGSGITAGAVAQHPAEQIDVIEIEPAVVAASRFFEAENRKVLSDPRVRLIVADGRNFLQNAQTGYDVIISEPSNPWIRGLATLFTREFFALAKRRLAPGGLMMQWIQSYGLAPEDLRMVAATFRTAFPHASLWNTTLSDNCLLGGTEPLAVPLGRIRARFEASAGLRADFARIGIPGPIGLLADLVLPPEDFARYAAQAPLNTDDTLRLEYSAPKSLYQLETAELNYAILRGYRHTMLSALDQADRKAVESAPGRHALGVAYLAKGLPQEAEAEFAMARLADPRHTESLLEEARLLAQRGLHVQALRMLEALLAREPRNPRVHFQLGALYQQQGLPEPALAAFERATALAPDRREYRLRLAELLRSQGNLTRARAEYDLLAERHPEDTDVLLPWAEVRLAQADVRGALEVLQPLRRGLSAYPGSTRAGIRHLAGVALVKAGQIPQAIRELEAAVRSSPGNADFRLALSLAYGAQGDLAQAAGALEQLLAIHPDHLAARQRLQELERRLEGQTP
ncbi:MAG: fused MFS/spermidine synthase [candidate division NC10 bacterium]|nr:fused MFS/spermidine synthase [candidate division NC10 bacterium]